MRLLSPLLVGVALAGAFSSAAAAAERPKLGVLVIFDQLRPDELHRYAPLFGKGGFGGLAARGSAAYDARYRYAVTETGPGHATIATGAHPNVHGICANRWKDDEGTTIYCVGDAEHSVFGAANEKPGISAQHMRAPTLGDSLKLATAGEGKVVSVALKDRAATLSAGAAADLAIFYDEDEGIFTTSTAWADSLPSWLKKAGRELPAKSRDEGEWTPLPTKKRAGVRLPPDERPGESLRYGFGTTFPHNLKDLESDDDKKKAYRTTPQSLEDLVSLALMAVDEEKLGSDAVPDLLVVGLSSTDYAGHYYGPGSLEVADLLRRADVQLRRLFRGLDERVGQQGWVMALTADHGSTPLPESFQARGLPAGRMSTEVLEQKLAEAAQRVLGEQALPVHLHSPHVYFDAAKVPEDKRAALYDELMRTLDSQEGVASVYRVDEAPAVTPADPLSATFAESAAAGRCDGLIIRPEPGYIFAWKTETGTDHGTPYTWDATVPLFISGPGVRRGRYADAVDPRDVASTLAFLLRVPAPALAAGKPLSAVGSEGSTSLFKP